MKKVLITILIALVFAGCAGHRKMIYRNQTERLDGLSISDKQIFLNNWEIGIILSQQDAISWIASDSIMKYFSEDQMREILGYLPYGDKENGKVLFFGNSNNNDGALILGEITMKNGTASIISSPYKTKEKEICNEYTCLKKAHDINKSYIETQKVNYNSYLISKDNLIIIYLFPGSDNKYIFFGGGTKTIFNKDDCSILSNESLHKSIVAHPFKDVMKYDMQARSSGITEVINEVDIAQYLIWMKYSYNQMIKTKKYTFFLYFNPENGRIARRAFTNEELTK